TPEPTPEPEASAAPSTSAAVTETPPAPEADIYDTHEDPGKRYMFAGVRYRGTIVPAAFEHLFVDEGGTFYSNSIGLELDMRKDGQSTIPWIQYTEYGTDDFLFKEKGKPNTVGNYSFVNSSLKALYLGLDEMWSVPIANHVEFEYGFGVGLGFVFGDLVDNWVTDQKGAPYAGAPVPVAATGAQYYKCTQV